jgi:MFS family permease
MVLMGTYASVELGQASVSGMMAMSGLGCAGFVTAVYTLAAVSFPDQLRASGIGICDAIGRVGGVLGAYFGVQFMAAGGPHGFFYLLASLMAISLVFLFILESANKAARRKVAPA